MPDIKKIGVAGAGAWGLALANMAAAAGRNVTLWGRDDAAMAELAATRRSPRLPGATLARGVLASADPHALADCQAVLLCAPAQAQRAMALGLANFFSRGATLVACAKGIENGSGLFMTQVLAEAAPRHSLAILSGPSFASDVAAGLPTAVTLASGDADLAKALCDALRNPSFRLYHTSDVRGVEIGGAAKNVLAIACGIAAGLDLGASAGAALIARGFAELTRFGEALGALPQTLMGLSGLGDLVLTCASRQSRNFQFGFDLGRGKSAATAGGGKLVEGASTAAALAAMAKAHRVEMPIVENVDAALQGRIDVIRAVGALLARPMRGETA